MLLLCASLAALAAGCKIAPPPAPDPNFQSQQGLLQNAIVRLESSQDKGGDAEVVRLLKRLETELAQSEQRHAEDQRKIAELTEQVQALRLAAGFAVDHIEILYFTHVSDKGIDLWVTPFDRHNDIVKTSGSFDIWINRPASWGITTRRLAAWKLAAKDVQDRWEGQLFEGYHLNLQWPEPGAPDVKTATLEVRFTTAEGKTYTATKELTIREQKP